MEYRREMELEEFSPEEFVERLAWRTVTSADDFKPEVLQGTFSEAISELEALLEMQKLKCFQVEQEFSREEQYLRSKLINLLQQNMTAQEQFVALEKKVSGVATKVVHLGDQLQSVNLPRERAGEAAKLMRHLADFLQPGSFLLTDVFRDPDRLFEAADLIQKLHVIAQDLSSSSDASASSNESSEKFDRAVKKINEKYEEIGRCLIEEFVKAQIVEDKERMKQIAHILNNFRCYSECINAFIEQSQLGGFRGRDVFDDVLPLCDQYKPLIDYVFPNPSSVMGKFVLHIFHGKIQETVSNTLLTEGKPSQDILLKNLSSLFSKTLRVIKQLESFDLGSDDDESLLHKVTQQIFRQHLESYIGKELQCLQKKCSNILAVYYDRLGHQKRRVTAPSSLQDIRRDLQVVIGTRANINIAQIEDFGGQTFLSEEVAINLLQESRVAYSRSSLLSRNKADVPGNACQIFDILSHSLIREHVDYALDLAQQGIPVADVKTVPKIHFFDVVKSCNAIVHLYEKEFIDSLLPLVSATSRMSDCMEKKKLLLEQIEMKLDAGIDRALETIAGWVKLVLQTENNRKEFFKADAINDDNVYEVSPSCTKIVKLIQSQREKIMDSMDGKNVEVVLTELGIRFHRVVYEHLLQYSYSSVGAFSVICDVGEYRKCARDFKISLISDMFDTLHALCSLLLVLPKDLPLNFNRDELTCLDAGIRMSFVQLRTDYKSAKVHLQNINAVTNNQSVKPTL